MNMTKYYGWLAILLPVLFSTASFAEEGLAIDNLVICQNKFINWVGVGDGMIHNFGEMAFDWRITGGTIMISHRFKTKYQGETFSYDLTGISNNVIVIKRGNIRFADTWKIKEMEKGTAIIAAEGKLEGYFLHPGKEDIRLPDQTGKMFVVGKQPVLEKEPHYFHFEHVSP